MEPGSDLNMPRLHLFEIEDQSWCPGIFRDLATDYLNFIQTRFALHRAMLSPLQDALQRSGATRVLDLCSGGGGPVLALYEALLSERTPVLLTLTDQYPNLGAFRRLSAQHPEGISYISHSVNATKVPRNLPGLRTLFNAFHHFAPESARAVLACAVEARQPIAIFEIPERRLSTILPLFLTPLFVAIATPLIRPFLWRRLFWTYIIPAVPFLCCWDGLVSQCRAYTLPELLDLTKGLDDYDWKAKQVSLGSTPGRLTYLVGIPKRSGGE
jgi:hypothetical protein